MGAMSVTLRNVVRGYMQKKSSQGLLRNLPGGMGLVTIDLKSTEEGYSLYRSVGFRDDHSKYHMMNVRLREQVHF